jgi:two-component system cell cycle response regulator
LTELRPPGGKKALRAFYAVTLLGLAAYFAYASWGVGGERFYTFFNTWVYNGLVLSAAASCVARALLVARERTAWLALGFGLLAWSAAEIIYSTYLAKMQWPPYPSISDGLWLLFYPASYVALVLLLRSRMEEFRASLWLDGVITALAVAAIGAAVVLQPVLETTEGTLSAVATDLAYPVGDLLLLAFVIAVFALTGWRPGRAWAFIGVGLAATAVADGLYLYQAAHGEYVEGTALDALWPASTLLVGYAAWQQGRPRGIELEGWRLLTIPTVFAFTALALLFWDHFEPLNSLAVGLGAATLVAVIVRMAMTFGENLRMLKASRREALTDALTGLGNRRRLLLDLRQALEDAHASPGQPRPRVLLLFDLDGFKHYNDSFGHPAGDALLARLGKNLEAAVLPYGEAYRLGGDEFCALVTAGAPGAETIIAAARSALTEQGRGFRVGASYGVVILPYEADDADLALQIADQRLYAHKGARRRSAVGQQTRDVLLQVLHERTPELHDHLHDVAQLAITVGRKMGLGPEELDEVARAAELHDVGKMAVPEEILNKPGPLDDVEWAVMKQHTIVGERILRAAPALLPVSKLVRSSHECWDGTGYPDGLAGEEIPLGARIVAVCDAFDAMTTSRPYKPAIPIADALHELRRCAGNQFDPNVVEVFCEIVVTTPAKHRGRRERVDISSDDGMLSALEAEVRRLAAEAQASVESRD